MGLVFVKTALVLYFKFLFGETRRRKIVTVEKRMLISNVCGSTLATSVGNKKFNLNHSESDVKKFWISSSDRKMLICMLQKQCISCDCYLELFWKAFFANSLAVLYHVV